MLITLYNRYGVAKTTLSPDNSSTQTKEIQGDNVLSLSFKLYEFIEIDVNDYVDFEGERYWVMERYMPTEKSSVEWVYNVKLYGIESLIKRFLILETTDGNAEPVFTLTAPPADHVRMIVKNINAGMEGAADFKVGRVDGDQNVVIDYEGKYCDEGLKALAEAVGVEWWIEGQTVNLCRCEIGDELRLGYGLGLTSLERDMADNAKFYTRLFPIGSSRNIDPASYGHSRLQLPGGAKYVDVNTEKYGVIHHYEKDAFSAIYPRRLGVVNSVRFADVKGDDGKPFRIYYFKDYSLTFDPNSYELAGEVKRVSFQTGELAGLGESDDYYFEVNFDSQSKEFEIITIWPYDDDQQLPGRNLVPKAGDEYILWNIRMPKEYYALAEKEYAAAVDEYNKKHELDVSIYKAPTDHEWIEKHEVELYVGRRVKLMSSEYFPEKGYRVSRITKVSRKVTLPNQMDLEISDALSTRTLTKIDDAIKDVKNYTQARMDSINVPDVIRSWEKTPPTDNNLYSARKTTKEFLSKLTPDIAQKLIKFLEGITVGDGSHGIDELGNVIAESIKSLDFQKGVLDGTGYGIYTDEKGKSVAEIDKLLVRMKMIIQELEIRKLAYVGNDQIYSSAGSHINNVKRLPSGDYRCYMLADDGTTRTMNDWRIGDQAFCKTSNIKAGVYQNVANRYYWRLVINRGEEWLVGGVPRRKIGSFKIGAHGVTTYTLPEDAYFSGKDIDGFTALVIDSVRYNPENIGNSVINEKVITGFVAKGTGIILRAEAGEYDVFTYDIPHENTVYDNWLRGIEEPVTLEGYSTDGVINLVLVVKDGKGIWAYVNKQRVMSAGRAYISVTLGQATFANNVASTVEQKLYNFIDLSDTRGSLEITGEDGQTYTCVGYDTSVENDAPLAEDDVAQLGSQTDKERQYAYIIYVSEQMRVDYAGINDFDLASHAVEKHSADGGFVHSDRFEIRSASGTGVSAPIVCDRGEWLSGMICGHYDRVSHNGSLWLCNAGKGRTTTEEPSEISTVWIRQVEKGAQGESRVTVELTTSDGDRAVLYREGQGLLTTMIATVYKGDKVITPEIHPSQLVWKRKTEAGGTDDEDWNARHTNTDFTMPVTFDDLVPPKTRFMAILYDEHGIESAQDIIEY